MRLSRIQTSSVILLAQTPISNRYLFGAYKNNGEATRFLSLPEDHERLGINGRTDPYGEKNLGSHPC